MHSEHALILGASSDIGCEIIRQIGHEGMTVLAQFHTNSAALDKLARQTPAAIVPIKADLASDIDLEAMFAVIEETCAFPTRIVFLAAPAVSLIRFKDMAWSDFQGQLDVQLRAAMLVCRRFLPKMAAAKEGKIVFVLTSYTLGVPPAAMAHYITAKYATLGLMKALASEFAGKKICINAISPSMVETGFLRDIPGKLIELTADQHPLKRNATPADIAPMVRLLLSDEASYMTGVNVPITGGSA